MGIETLIGGGLALGGALLNKKSSDKAVGAQQQASGDATAEARRQYDITRQDQLNLLTQQRADQAPWLQAGQNALTQIAAGTQPGGQYAKTFTGADLASDPGYQFRLDQGNQAIERSAAARGGLLSGAAAKALTKYSQGVASDEYSNAYNRFNNDQSTQYNRLASLAGVGQAATNQVGQAGQNAYGTIASAGQNTSNAIQNNLTGAGNARASGYVAGANALTGAIGQGVNWYQNNQLLNKLGGGNTSSIFGGAQYATLGDGMWGGV
jgi:hypothetical protein